MSLARKISLTIGVLALFVSLQLLPGCLGKPTGQSGSPSGSKTPFDSNSLYLPRSIISPSWLEERGRKQREAAAQSDLFTSFLYTDRLSESGIQFRHRIVDDSGKEYTPNHYDHGNGVAAADVNGDGRSDLYLVNQAGANELWVNLGGGRFADMTTSQLALADRICVAASFADVDNDGDADLFVTSVRGGNALLENDGTGRFADVTVAAGLEYHGHSSAALFFDYDRDGWLDLLLSNVGNYTRDLAVTNTAGPSYFPGRRRAFSLHLEPELSETSLLYRNLGNGRFADMTTALGLVDSSWSGDAGALDVNEDGWADIYLLNMQGHDQYYENLNGRRFVRKSRQLFPRTPWGSMGIQVFDWDNDGLMDLFITDMHSDMSAGVDWRAEKEKSDVSYTEKYLRSGGASIFGNAFYSSLGGGRFEEVSDAINVENYWPWGLSTGDLNADGWEDVFITASMNYPFRYGVNSLLLNERGRKFLDSEFILGVEPRARLSTPFFELDCAGPDRMHRHCGGEGGQVLVHGARGSRASILLDLEGDGDLDIVTNDFNSEPMVLVSDLSERKPLLRFLKIELVGTRSNRNGLGAIVAVQVGERTLTQRRDGRSGYLSQSVLPLYFGLDEAASADAIEVRWPSGSRQSLTGPIAANQLLVIEEPR